MSKTPKAPKRAKPIATGSDWTFPLLDKYYKEIEIISREELRQDVFPNQIEIITSEQMLDAYASGGMPLNYGHWSYGKEFVRNQESYRKGFSGLAYEIVINTNPAIAYLMEENDLIHQVLVMAHACFGHNAFFKHNYLFKHWTQPDVILDYLDFAKKYIAECERKYGPDEVEATIDACHALQQYGVDKYKKPKRLSRDQEEARQLDRENYIQSQLNEIWNTVPKAKTKDGEQDDDEDKFPKHPEENLLYFIEKNAPNLPTWKREIVRIIRKISQYFYPQGQTKVSNEGYATFTHYYILNRLYDKGFLTDGQMIAFLSSHCNVTMQRGYNQRGGARINPYALGFAIYRDLKRMCLEPTDEDRQWFPNIAGNPDWVSVHHDAMSNYRDESFILQFLSPKVMRDMKLFAICDQESKPNHYDVTVIHNDQGYRELRELLAKQNDRSYTVPQLEVVDVNRWGDRALTMLHYPHNAKLLDRENAIKTLHYFYYLWGYPVKLETATGKIKQVLEVNSLEG